MFINDYFSKISLIILTSYLFFFSTYCVSQELPSGPCLGQNPPGLEPEIFALGIISLENRFEQNGSFSPNGKEFYFVVTNQFA